MRGLLWVLLIFAVAVAGAGTLGRNDGLVAIFWGHWRTDLSLNLFVLLTLAACAVVVWAGHTINRLLSLPRRAQEWRTLRKERAAHAALREAQLSLLAGRYGRARKASERALSLQAEVPDLAPVHDFAAVASGLAAASAHHLQDRERRQALWTHALASAEASTVRDWGDAMHLQQASWALEDRDHDSAQAALLRLSPGAQRRTQAMKLRLHAARAAREPLQALQTARLLAHHKAYSPAVAQSLLRALANEALEQARDAEQLRRVWSQLDRNERQDPVVATRAATLARTVGSAGDGQRWLRPLLEPDIDKRLDSKDRERVALALLDAADPAHALPADSRATTPGGTGIPPTNAPTSTPTELLSTLERWTQLHPTQGSVQAAVGRSFANAGLYGKARQQLDSAVLDPELPARARRIAWRTLADLAAREGDTDRSAHCLRQAAAAE